MRVAHHGTFNNNIQYNIVHIVTPLFIEFVNYDKKIKFYRDAKIQYKEKCQAREREKTDNTFLLEPRVTLTMMRECWQRRIQQCHSPHIEIKHRRTDGANKTETREQCKMAKPNPDCGRAEPVEHREKKSRNE